MNLIKPQKLNQGDKIGILALSGAVNSKKNIVRAKKYFEKLGYKIVLSKNIFDQNRYLAGKDEKKVEELHRFFSDNSINAILCSRGGFGALRLLDKIDFDLIRKNPKIFAGYSDTTAIESKIFTETGLITFYSPMAEQDFGSKELSEYTIGNFFKTLQNSDSLELPASKYSKIYYEGKARGNLWGGNLATIASLCGQNFIPDENFIFFIEEVSEETYKIDRMMSQLFNIEKFKSNLQGIILGEFLGISNQKHFDELFFEIGEKFKKPILSGFRITHAKEKITLPYGANAEFSTNTKVLKIDSYLNP